MLTAILKYAKKLMIILLMSAMIICHIPNGSYSYADYSENEIRNVQVVIRAGEWGNENQAKPGKRYIIGSDINISQHGISIKDIPTDIPLRKENNQWFISEFDINLKLARAIAKKLDSKYGVDVNLQYATSKSQDLNAAGRRAASCNPKIYLSVHHNSYKEDSTGYFFMCNEGDYNSAVMAKKLSNSMSNNKMIPQRENRVNKDGYIGELNEVAKEGRISILGEFGFFNKAEIVKICSDEYVDYVSDKMAETLYHQLQSMNGIKQAEEKTKDTMYVAEKEEPEEITIRFTNNDCVVDNGEVVVSFK